MKRNVKKKKLKKSPLIATQERLNNFQTKFPYKFRQVFENYQKGQQELFHGDVHGAKQSFEKALSIYSEYIPAINHLAVIFGMLDNFQEAFQKVKKVLILDDKNVFALTQGALFLYRLERGKEAVNYANKALAAFEERQGRDPYHDYDNLQKLVEMLSVLGEDALLHQLYNARNASFAPMSFYRAALALSNEGAYDEAKNAFQKINNKEPIKEKSEILTKNLQLFCEEGLPIPLLHAEKDLGFEQLLAVSSLYSESEREKQSSFDFINNHYSSWSLEVIKGLLKSKRLEDWLKKQLLSTLARWDEGKEPITLWLEGAWQQISLQQVELSLNERLSEIFAAAKKNVQEENWEEAIVQFQKVREAAPTYIPTYIQLAKLYLKIKDYRKVEEALKQAESVAPLAPVYLGYGKYYLAINELTKAKEALTSFDTRELELMEDVYDAIILKVELTSKLEGSEKALQVFQEEKVKFKFVLDEWEHFEESVQKLIGSTSSASNEVDLERQNLTQLLENYTKDKLVALAKRYKIRGYSKLNKKDLIELIETKFSEDGAWKTLLTDQEQQKVLEVASEEEIVNYVKEHIEQL